MAARRSLPTLKIDLLHPQSIQSPLSLRLLKWLITSGRYIVVVAELIVIGAFISRFKFDSDLGALQDSIKEQVPYIQSLKNDEDLIRQTQFQLATVKHLREDNPQWGQILTKLSALTPQNTRITSFNFDRLQSYPKLSLTINGQATSNSELAAFIKALQGDTTFNNVALTNLSYDRQLVVFTISCGINLQGANNGG